MALTIRPGLLADADVFTTLVNVHHEAFTGEPLWSIDEIRTQLVTTTAQPHRDDRYIELDGVPVAGMHTRFYEPYEVGRIDLAIPLQDERDAVTALLVDAALRILRSRSVPGVDAIAQATVPSEDVEVIEVLRGRGFGVTGRLSLLEMPVGALQASAPPPGIRVVPYDIRHHLDDGFTVLDQAFPTPGSNWYLVRDDYEHMMRNDPTALAGLSLMAFRDTTPVGVCINFVDTMRPDAGHIGMLGVVRDQRRSGIGRALFAESLRSFSERGWTHARLTTITPADGIGGEDAGGFFRSVGMTTVYDHDIMSRSLADRP